MPTIKVTSPYDQTLIKKIKLNNKKEVQAAISLAHKTFADRKLWLEPYQRINILQSVINLMQTQISDLALLAAQEGGKPYKDSLIEVERAINGVKLAMEYISQLKGEQIPMGLTPASSKRLAFTIKEPIGVVSAISAFNHPLNLIVHQVIPAIAVGAPVIIKPSLSTPLSCLNFIQILYQAGLPKPWCQVVLCKKNAAQTLVTDKRISFFSFIGSAKVGWKLRSKLAPGTHCALEHGGVAPVIVEKDANIKRLIPALIKGGFYHAGQVCVSVQRIFIHQDICEKVAQQLTKKAQALIVGDPLDKNTDIGPLISLQEVKRIHDWVTAAIKEGATCLCGGKPMSDSCYQPTILLNPSAKSLVSTKEIFAPVICLYSYQDREEAILQANSLNYSFQAAIFTQNLDIAFESVNKLNATAVMVNDHTAFRVDWMPFGGRKSSGMGVGGIAYSMNDMMVDKMMVFNQS